MPEIFLLLRASAKKRVISKTEVMVMTPASGEKEHGVCWEEPRSEPAWIYRSGPQLVGASIENGVGTSVGLLVRDIVGLSVGARVGLSVGASVGNGVGTSVGLSVYQSEPWLEPRSGTAQVYWSELLFLKKLLTYEEEHHG